MARALSHGDLPIVVILARREFEAWFLAAAESLRDKGRLPDDLESPADPESIRGAKEWLSDRMPIGRSYAETTDQPALTADFDMRAARRADSFDKCYREIRSMLEQLLHRPWKQVRSHNSWLALVYCAAAGSPSSDASYPAGR